MVWYYFTASGICWEAVSWNILLAEDDEGQLYNHICHLENRYEAG